HLLPLSLHDALPILTLLPTSSPKERWTIFLRDPSSFLVIFSFSITISPSTPVFFAVIQSLHLSGHYMPFRCCLCPLCFQVEKIHLCGPPAVSYVCAHDGMHQSRISRISAPDL